MPFAVGLLVLAGLAAVVVIAVVVSFDALDPGSLNDDDWYWDEETDTL